MSLKFYVNYQNELLIYNNLCPALVFIKFVGGELYFKIPAKNTSKQMELFNK